MASKTGHWNQVVRLLVVAAVAFLVVGCPSQSTSGTLNLKISLDFDSRAEEEQLWNAGTITAEGSFPVAKLDTMNMNTEVAWDLLGTTPWTATTEQQMGDYTGDCNGGECNPCVGEFSGTWEIEAVQLNMQERGNGRYVFELWLGSENPPHVGGCVAMINQPATWGGELLITLTDIGTATPSATADGVTIEVSVT